MTLADLFTAIANAIRAKGGTSAALYPNQMAQAISDIQLSVNLQTKTATPSETAQAITADAGFDGLQEVDVAAVSSNYVGTGITRRDSTDLTATGATIEAPAGYYAATASKAIGNGSATTPATTITATPSISVSNAGLITASVSASKSITPSVSAGYVSAGTAGNVSVSGSNTSQLSTQAAATITPSTTQQTAVAANKYTLGEVKVDPIPSQYIVPTGDKSITSNGTNIDVAQYATVSVNVPGGGSSKNAQIAAGVDRVAATTYTAVNGQSITVAKTGTYDVYWTGYRSSTSGTNGSQLYVAGTPYGTAQTTFTNNAQSIHISGVALTANQTVAVRARSRSTSYYMYVGNLTIIEA